MLIDRDRMEQLGRELSEARAQLAETERQRVFAGEALLDQCGISADLLEQLAAIRELVEPLVELERWATPAPWDIDTAYQNIHYNKQGRALTFQSMGLSNEDTNLIMAMRSLLPKLAEAVK